MSIILLRLENEQNRRMHDVAYWRTIIEQTSEVNIIMRFLRKPKHGSGIPAVAFGVKCHTPC